MFDRHTLEAIAADHQREILEDAARQRLIREAQRAAKMEARRLERARRREISTLPAAAPIGLRLALARILRAIAARLDRAAEPSFVDAGMSAAR